MLVLVRTWNFSFSTIGTLIFLYFTLDLNHNLLRLLRKTLRLLMPMSWNASSRSLQFYASLVLVLTFLIIMLVHLRFWSYILYKMKGFALMFFFIHVFARSKFCPSLIENISLKVPSCSCTKFSIACIYCASARCATASYLVCSNMDMFRKPIRLLKHILP